MQTADACPRQEINAMSLPQLELPHPEWQAPPVHEEPTLRPLSGRERLPAIDALRGLAIVGVLVAYTLWNLGGQPGDRLSALDRVIEVLGATFVDSKCLTIFAFLFGAGCARQWRRAESRGSSVPRFHLRRMLFLLVVGLAHAVLLRNGDILAPYALMGLSLLAIRNASNRQLVVVAVVLALLPYAVMPALKAAGLSLAHRPAEERSASYFSANFAWLRFWYETNPVTEWPRILAVVVAGVWAERAGFIRRVVTNRRLALRLSIAAAVVAVVSRGLLYAIAFLWNARSLPAVRMFVLGQTYDLSAWSLAAVYAAVFALLCMRPRWAARLAWLRAMGRMAFSNYLLQALLVVPACLAFGWFDHVTPSGGLLLAFAVMAVEIPFSVWWLKGHEYGPVEFLWRSVAYGSR
jgi:uncharacterized protein